MLTVAHAEIEAACEHYPLIHVSPRLLHAGVSEKLGALSGGPAMRIIVHQSLFWGPRPPFMETPFWHASRL